jgi:hypothetical protein
MIEELNAYLIGLNFAPVGRCSCKGRPYRWKHRDGFEVKLYNDNTWQLLQGGIVRYGHKDTAIEEINEYFLHLMGQTGYTPWTPDGVAD